MVRVMWTQNSLALNADSSKTLKMRTSNSMYMFYGHSGYDLFNILRKHGMARSHDYWNFGVLNAYSSKVTKMLLNDYYVKKI